jgi:hypothetical protein
MNFEIISIFSEIHSFIQKNLPITTTILTRNHSKSSPVAPPDFHRPHLFASLPLLGAVNVILRESAVVMRDAVCVGCRLVAGAGIDMASAAASRAALQFAVTILLLCCLTADAK